MKTLQSSRDSVALSDRMDQSDIKGQKLLEALFKVQYDFTRPSNLNQNSISSVNSLEMMLMAPIDILVFE